MNSSLDTLQKLLTEIGWNPQPTADGAGCYVTFGPSHSVAEAFALITVKPDRFVFYLNFGPSVPAERREEVARFVTLANWGLLIGNFELRFDDGFVRFKASVEFTGMELGATL